jgi:hypothetical protein
VLGSTRPPQPPCASGHSIAEIMAAPAGAQAERAGHRAYLKDDWLF